MNTPTPSGTSRCVVMDIRVGESITFRPSLDSPEIVLTIEAKSGTRARVRVQADDSVKVGRPEKAKA